LPQCDVHCLLREDYLPEEQEIAEYDTARELTTNVSSVRKLGARWWP